MKPPIQTRAIHLAISPHEGVHIGRDGRMPRYFIRTIFLAVALCSGSVRPGLAEDASAAHTAPVAVRLWLRDGSVRGAQLIAQSATTDAPPSPAMHFRTPTGELTLWMDALVSISDVIDRPGAEEASALFRIERGLPRRLKLGSTTENVLIENEDGTREVVNLRKIARLQVVRRTAVVRAGD